MGITQGLLGPTVTFAGVCVTRVAEVLSVRGDKARVRFADGGATRLVDVSMVDAKKGGFVEVFADQALSALSEEEADWKTQVWTELRHKLVEATAD